MKAHFNYLKDAADSGTVILAGPCLDETFGLVILQAENFEKAQKFMFDDPSVMNNVMMAEIHPFRISLLSQNEHSNKTLE